MAANKELSCAAVRQIRDDTDALELLISGSSSRQRDASADDDLEQAAHRAARLATPTGSATDWHLAWNRLDRLQQIIHMEWSPRRDRSAVDESDLILPICALRAEMLTTLEQSNGLFHRTTPLAPLGLPRSSDTAERALQQRIEGRPLDAIAKTADVDRWTAEAMVRRHLFERIDRLAPTFTHHRRVTYERHQQLLLHELSRATPTDAHLARQFVHLVRRHAGLLGLIPVPVPGARR